MPPAPRFDAPIYNFAMEIDDRLEMERIELLRKGRPPPAPLPHIAALPVCGECGCAELFSGGDGEPELVCADCFASGRMAAMEVRRGWYRAEVRNPFGAAFDEYHFYVDHKFAGRIFQADAAYTAVSQQPVHCRNVWQAEAVGESEAAICAKAGDAMRWVENLAAFWRRVLR